MQAEGLVRTGLHTSQIAALAGDTRSISAAGSTQSAATEINATNLLVTVASADQGIRLPASARAGDMFFLMNVSANAGRIYPATGGRLNNGSVNAHVTFAANKTHIVRMINDRDALVFISA